MVKSIEIVRGIPVIISPSYPKHPAALNSFSGKRNIAEIFGRTFVPTVIIGGGCGSFNNLQKELNTNMKKPPHEYLYICKCSG